MPVYRTSGVLTDTIAAENVPAAQKYLEQDHNGKPIHMEQYLDEAFTGVVELLEWRLDGDGHRWTVTAFANRELSDAELKQLASEVSGQNSDGLGEGFEQQPFAETDNGREEVCIECSGRGVADLDGNDDFCGACEGEGSWTDEDWSMISFDWKSNPCTFVRV